jgi:hypothetical protein
MLTEDQKFLFDVNGCLTVELMLELIGDGFRFDTLKGTIMTRGTEGFRLHGGDTADGGPRRVRGLRRRADAASARRIRTAYYLNRPKISQLLAEELRGGALDSDGVT